MQATQAQAAVADAAGVVTGIQITFDVKSFPNCLTLNAKRKNRLDFFGAMGGGGSNPSAGIDDDADSQDFGGHAPSYMFADRSSSAYGDEGVINRDERQEKFNQLYVKLLVHHAATVLGLALNSAESGEHLCVRFVVNANSLGQATTIVATVVGCDAGFMRELFIFSDLLTITKVEPSSYVPVLEGGAELDKGISTKYSYSLGEMLTEQSSVLPRSELSRFIESETEDFFVKYRKCVAMLIERNDDGIGSHFSSMFGAEQRRNDIAFLNIHPLRRCGKLEFFQNPKIAKNCFEIVPLEEKQKQAIAMLNAALIKADIAVANLTVCKNKKSRKVWVKGLTEAEANKVNAILQKSFPGVNFKCKERGAEAEERPLFGVTINYATLDPRSMKNFIVPEQAATAAPAAAAQRP